MGTERLSERITVRLSGEQLAKLQTTAERRGVEVSTLVRELALRQLQSSPITPAEAEAAIADAYETAALEVLPQYENADAPLEDQLAALSQTEADLRARKSRLQGQKSELARQRAEALRAGDADRAAGLGREIGDLENEINTITETLEALGQTRLELYGLVRERDAAIKERASELLADTLVKAADGVDTKLKEIAQALDVLAILWREVQPGGEDWAAWQARLSAHIWDAIAQNAVSHEVSEFARQRKPWLLNFDPGKPLAKRLGIRDKVVVS